ncbi:MAG: glycosyltransferase family 4 protein [Patescibacteria group bacterium]
MKVVIVTQAVDRDDPNLGAFYHWFRLLADRVDSLVIITGRAGLTDFPPHVSVLTFPKHEGVLGRIRRLWKFWTHCATHFASADAIFFHQIPEFVLAASPFLLGRRESASLWYAHGAVSWRLRLAERLVDMVFTSSEAGFRIPSKKVIYLGQAINTDLFKPVTKQRTDVRGEKPLRMISVGRISPVKQYETIIAACAILREASIMPWTLTIVGGPLTPADRVYAEKLRSLVREKGLEDRISFEGPRPYSAVPALLGACDMFLNCSRTGSLDKAVLEAMACGLTVITSNEGYRPILPPGYFLESIRPEALADRITTLAEEKRPNLALREIVVRDHALGPTIDRMARFLIPSQERGYVYPSVV